MKKELALVLGTVIVTYGLVRYLLPPKVIEKTIPQIITKHDTVSVVPEWFADSVKHWKKRKHTTDTVNIYVTTTVVRDTGSTRIIHTGCNPESRSKVWPILLYHGSRKFGDTGTVATFDLRDTVGVVALSKVYISGYLTSIEADTGMQPKMTFEPFPTQRKPSLWHNIKMLGLGFGACSIYNGVK